MQKKFTILILILLICSILGIIYAKKGDLKWIDIGKFINDYLISKTETPDWLFKIDDYCVSLDEYNDGYQFFLNQLSEEQKKLITDPSLIKKQYFNNLLMQNIILIKLLNSKQLIESEEFQTYFKLAVRQAIYQYYVSKFLPKDKNKFKPSDKEITDFYNQNKDKLLSMGLTAEQIRQYAIQELTQRKLQLWLEDFLEQTKEEFKIKRNQKALKDAGLD